MVAARQLPPKECSYVSYLDAILAVQDAETCALQRQLQRMCYDDVLRCGRWRVEYLLLEEGYPHFRLYYRRQCLGIADIAGERSLPGVRRKLAAYLKWVGFRAAVTEHKPGAARTPLSAGKNVPKLFK